MVIRHDQRVQYFGDGGCRPPRMLSAAPTKSHAMSVTEEPNGLKRIADGAQAADREEEED